MSVGFSLEGVALLRKQSILQRVKTFCYCDMIKGCSKTEI